MRQVVSCKQVTETHMGNISEHIWNDALVYQTLCRGTQRLPTVHTFSQIYTFLLFLHFFFTQSNKIMILKDLVTRPKTCKQCLQQQSMHL